MALLRQSSTWPVHRVRDLHSKAQLSYLWQMLLPDKNGNLSQGLTFVAQRVGIPGVEMDRVAYSVGGQENYHLGASRRGGVVSATFLEVEGGEVDAFFRVWFDIVDGTSKEVNLESRARKPKGTGAPEDGYARRGFVRLFTRLGTLSMEWELLRLLPLRIGRYEVTYEGSGAMLLPVEMVCDEVRRTR